METKEARDHYSIRVQIENDSNRIYNQPYSMSTLDLTYEALQEYYQSIRNSQIDSILGLDTVGSQKYFNDTIQNTRIDSSRESDLGNLSTSSSLLTCSEEQSDDCFMGFDYFCNEGNILGDENIVNTDNIILEDHFSDLHEVLDIDSNNKLEYDPTIAMNEVENFFVPNFEPVHSDNEFYDLSCENEKLMSTEFALNRINYKSESIRNSSDEK